MSVTGTLQPERVFAYFEKLCAVPHGSGNTAQISDLCVGFAKELGLRCRQDALHNVVIWKDASAGYENAPTVILQGHLDMVCAKTDGCAKNMAEEGLELRTDGEYLWAENTTLGADDGVAVAMALAVLSDDSLPHPPLEVVFTVDEETGMDGAVGLDCSDLKGRILFNIDSEDEGVFTVSCAGGVRCNGFIPGAAEAAKDQTGYRVTISGLLGGHSGSEIHKGRASASHLMGRVLYMAQRSVPSLRVARLCGGQVDNAICAFCSAEVCLAPEQATDFEAFIRDFERLLKNEYAASDAGLCLRAEAIPADTAFDLQSSRRMLRALFTLPQGVQEMSMSLPGLVQTSVNLGVVRTEKDGLHFSCSVRSSIASQKEMLAQKLEAVTQAAGGTLSQHGSYPGWQYRPDSPLRELALDAYRAVTGKEGRAQAIHAGLECGLFMEKMPGLDAVSFGPDLYDIHTVNERLNIASTGRIYALVCEMLRRCR